MSFNHYFSSSSSDTVLNQMGLDIMTEYLNISGCDTSAMDQYEILETYINYHIWQDERVVQFFKYTNSD